MTKYSFCTALLFSSFATLFTACSESGLDSNNGITLDLSKPVPELWVQSSYTYSIKNDTLTRSRSTKVCKIGGFDSIANISYSYQYTPKKLTPISTGSVLTNGSSIENSIWLEIYNSSNKTDTSYRYFTGGKQYSIIYNTCPFSEESISTFKKSPQMYAHFGFTIDTNSIQQSCNTRRYIEKDSSGKSNEIQTSVNIQVNGKILTSVTNSTSVNGKQCSYTSNRTAYSTINCATAWSQYLIDNNNDTTDVDGSWYEKYYDDRVKEDAYNTCVNNALK